MSTRATAIISTGSDCPIRRPIVAGLLLLVSPLTAAVHGVPEAPRPGPQPMVWAAFENDFFCDRILNADDYRTGGGNAGAIVPLDGGWDVVARYDYAALTRRGSGSGSTDRSRIDVQSGAAGLALTGVAGPWRWRAAGGAGALFSGDFGGDGIQNSIHGNISDQPLDLPYEHRLRWTSYLWADAEASLTVLGALPAGLGPGGVDVRVRGSFAATAAGSLPFDLGASLIGTGQAGVWWIGGRYLGLDRRPLSDTAAATARREMGWWVGAGTAVLATSSGLSLTYGAEVNPRSGATAGTLALDWQPPRSVEPGPDVRQGFLHGVGTRGFAVQLVAPSRQLPRGTWWAVDGAVEYRWGKGEGYRIEGCEVQVDQLAGGLEASAGTPAGSWVRADLCAQALIGARVERVAVLSPQAAYQQDTAARPVAVGALRMHLGTDAAGPDWSFLNRFRPGVGLRYTVPWRSARAEAAQGGGSLAYQRPRLGWDWELAFISRW
jgi:hypothetical protein